MTAMTEERAKEIVAKGDSPYLKVPAQEAPRFKIYIDYVEAVSFLAGLSAERERTRRLVEAAKPRKGLTERQWRNIWVRYVRHGATDIVWHSSFDKYVIAKIVNEALERRKSR